MYVPEHIQEYLQEGSLYNEKEKKEQRKKESLITDTGKNPLFTIAQEEFPININTSLIETEWESMIKKKVNY